MTTTPAPVIPGELRSTTDKPVVRIRDLVKTFERADGTVVKAIDGVSLDVNPGEFIVLLGPSGCGKTTLLRSIAGLEHADSGMINIQGKTAFSSAENVNLAPERRDLSMIFQSYALWPHMTAAKNIAYPLESIRPKLGNAAIQKRVARVLELVGIPELAKQYPNQMSGGQQQRVALARALVGEDGLILFDEPLSNVDARVREQLRVELVSMQRELGFAALFVTHDQVEAMQLAHKIAVMDNGHVSQYGTPQELYHEPANRYVANFIGTTNEFEGKVVAVDAEGISVQTDLGVLRGVSESSSIGPDQAVIALCRPEQCLLSPDEPSAVNRWPATVVASLFVGSHTEHILRTGDHVVRVWNTSHSTMEQGASLWISVDDANVRVLAAGEQATSA